MPSFKLDGKPIPFEPGDSIIHAARKAGVEIPHYCWHPGLSAPANCRMCLVEIKPPPGQRPLQLDVLELDKRSGEYRYVQKPKLQPACQYPEYRHIYPALLSLRGFFDPGAYVQINACETGRDPKMLQTLASMWGVPVIGWTGDLMYSTDGLGGGGGGGKADLTFEAGQTTVCVSQMCVTY